MIGQIEHGVPVGYGIIYNVQTAVGIQTVGDADDGVSGEALVTVGAVQFKSDEIIA